MSDIRRVGGLAPPFLFGGSMKATYRVFAYLIALGVLSQAMAIALGGFTMIHDIDEGMIVDKNFDDFNFGQNWHATVGMMVMPALALLFLIVSFFAKVPGGVKWAGITFLLVALQITLAFVAFGVPAVGALHGINALVLMGVAAQAGHRVDTSPPVKAEAPAPDSGATV
jgi:hypothetical protein